MKDPEIAFLTALNRFLANHQQAIFRYLLLGSLVVLLTLLMPRDGIFKYTYELNKPWKYESLYAPFDFALVKSDEEFQADRNEVLSQFQAFYAVDSNIIIRQKAAFQELFPLYWDSLQLKHPDLEPKDSLLHRRWGLDMLQYVYQKGIIRLSAEDRQKNDLKKIALLSGLHEYRTVDLEQLFTLKSAYFFISDSLRKVPHLYPEILLPLFEQTIQHNIEYAEELSGRLLDEKLSEVSPTRGMIQAGEMVIMKGNIITPEKYKVIESFEKEHQNRIIGRRSMTWIIVGNLLLAALIVIIFGFFLFLFSREVFLSNRKLAFIMLLMAIYWIMVHQITLWDTSMLYAIPFCILPIIIRTFFNAAISLQSFITMMLPVSVMVPLGNEFLILQILAGTVAVFTHVRAYYWSQFFSSMAFILVTYLLGFLSIEMIADGNIKQIDLPIFGLLALNVLLTLLAYPLIPIFEKLFGLVSEITLIELSDINKPLLKELSIKAPGTFQHSLQVANLCEASAIAIGANHILVKTGALYHDIGKMQNPDYFIENQRGFSNPHDELALEDSAKVIIGHVKAGIDLAKKNGVPDLIIDFIRTHHGTTRVEYFYQNFLKNFPHESIDEDLFRYPGPLPYSKETAILMMADAVEAASRSLKNPTNEDIDGLVEKLVDHKITQHQFIQCNISFSEIETCKKVMKKLLYSIHHVRIAYPEIKSVSL